MNLLHLRLYAATVVTQFGNWLTFLAIAFFVKENFGAEKVAMTFLIQSLPALVLSRGFAKIVPHSKNFSVYCTLQLVLAALVLGLTLNNSLNGIYAFLLISSIVKTLTQPLFQSLVGDWTEKSEQQTVFTRIGAIQACLLTVAPAIGGWLGASIGYKALFIIDSATFLVSLALLFPKPKTVNVFEDSKEATHAFAQSFLKKPSINPNTQKWLTVWFALLFFGATLNGTEFLVFERGGLSKQEIGNALACWGVGNILVFIFGSRIKSWISDRTNIALLLLASIVYLLASLTPDTIYVAFLLLGTTYALSSGLVRSKLQASITPNEKPLAVWSYANQFLALINIVVYASYGTIGSKLHPAYLIGVGAMALVFALFRADNSKQLSPDASK